MSYQTNPIENHKPNQSKSKLQVSAFGLDVFRFFYATAWFGSVCGFYFTNQIKPNYNIRETLIKLMLILTMETFIK